MMTPCLCLLKVFCPLTLDLMMVRHAAVYLVILCVMLWRYANVVVFNLKYLEQLMLGASLLALH